MRLVIAVLLVLLMTRGSDQQSLRMTALENGGEATAIIDVDEPVLTLTQRVERSDLILHGTVTGSRTVLFMNDCYVGTESVWFLRYNQEAASFNFVGGQFGSFKIAGGRVRPHTEEVIARRGDVPVDRAVFLQDVQNHVNGTPPR